MEKFPGSVKTSTIAESVDAISANQLGCRVLWSEDMNHGQRYGGVTVRNPFL
jgi:predicted nucleic acid-binding protein